MTFKTDYFANSFDYIKLERVEEKSTESNIFYSVYFVNNILELKVVL